MTIQSPVLMKQFLLSTLFLSFAIASFAQVQGDTIEIKTFNYTQTKGGGIRDTVIDFSVLPNVTFEKVLMKYNMRCKEAKVSTSTSRNLGCGEWDYSCNTYFHDSSMIDSILALHPDFTISGFSGETFDYTTKALYDFYQFEYKDMVVDDIRSEDSFKVLSGNESMVDATKGTNNAGRAQYLYTAKELAEAGFEAGDIDGFLIGAMDDGAVNFLRIRIKQTKDTVLSAKAPHLNGFSEVYFGNYDFSTGTNRVQFHTPFNWDGADNIIIDWSFTHTVAQSDIRLEGTPSEDMGIHAADGFTADLTGDSHIDISTDGLSSITNEITVSFWVYGDEDALPANTSIIEGSTEGGQRDLNIHLPWGNGSVYFDCGSEGGSYDRIDKEADEEDLEGQWNHWAFTKNATTGSMKMYLNGKLWKSGTGKKRPLDLAKLVVGKNRFYGNSYTGYMDELRIWDAELTKKEIEDWMNISVDASHPKYSNLVAYYKFDEGMGATVNDASAKGGKGEANNSYIWSRPRGDELIRFFNKSDFRPSITLLSGAYDSTVVITEVLDSVQRTPNTVKEYEIIENVGVLKHDEVVEVDEMITWEANDEVVYDAKTGNQIRKRTVTSEGSIEPEDLRYYQRWPAKVEIMSFVTPYGIGLDLGENGKTWTFDMSDYLPILNGKKRMTMEAGGQRQEDMDIRFLFIVGTPTREVIGFNQLWRPASRNYSSIQADRYFPPIELEMNPQAKAYKIRTAITGHGQQGEFIPQQHYIDVNGGSYEYVWEAWKECADNPVYPQGGTWIYDRAGWCPGAATDVQHQDITEFVKPGEAATIDYGVLGGSGDSRYIVNSQLISYGPINHSLDASVLAVKEPSNRVEFQRFNSMCNKPTIIIENTGSSELTSLKINYWVNGASKKETFEWKGNLKFTETAEVELPYTDDLWSPVTATGNAFHVEISEPNGGVDEYAPNNVYTSYFQLPEVLPSHMVLDFRTNAAAYENNYRIVDNLGNTIFSRDNMEANTSYRDTLHLPLGCYSLIVEDQDDDGIRFFANNDGSGAFRVFKVGGGLAKTFNGDFGDGIRYNFTVNFPLSFEEVNLVKEIDVFPNPSQGSFRVDLNNFDKDYTLEVFNATGQKMTSFSGKANVLNSHTVNLEGHSGVYFVRASIGGETFTETVVIK